MTPARAGLGARGRHPLLPGRSRCGHLCCRCAQLAAGWARGGGASAWPTWPLAAQAGELRPAARRVCSRPRSSRPPALLPPALPPGFLCLVRTLCCMTALTPDSKGGPRARAHCLRPHRGAAWASVSGDTGSPARGHTPGGSPGGRLRWPSPPSAACRPHPALDAGQCPPLPRMQCPHAVCEQRPWEKRLLREGAGGLPAGSNQGETGHRPQGETEKLFWCCLGWGPLPSPRLHERPPWRSARGLRMQPAGGASEADSRWSPCPWVRT